MVVMDFSEPTAVARFRPVDDRVMGGISRSRLKASRGGAAAFEGTLSLERNGGFASVRASDLALDLSGAKGLVLRVRGDDKIYKLRLADREAFDSISFSKAFVAPSGAWSEIRIGFDELAPTWRGRMVEGAKPLNLKRIRRLGLMISDKQDGTFRLEIASIKAYRD